MSTKPETAEFIEDQLGFICDDTLFIKPSKVDPAYLEGTHPGQAYPGSKPKKPKAPKK